MSTLAAAERPEVSVLDCAIQRLDQKDFRVRLSSALDEADLDLCSSEALNRVFRRRGLLERRRGSRSLTEFRTLTTSSCRASAVLLSSRTWFRQRG